MLEGKTDGDGLVMSGLVEFGKNMGKTGFWCSRIVNGRELPVRACPHLGNNGDCGIDIGAFAMTFADVHNL